MTVALFFVIFTLYVLMIIYYKIKESKYKKRYINYKQVKKVTAIDFIIDITRIILGLFYIYFGVILLPVLGIFSFILPGIEDLVNDFRKYKNQKVKD